MHADICGWASEAMYQGRLTCVFVCNSVCLCVLCGRVHTCACGSGLCVCVCVSVWAFAHGSSNPQYPNTNTPSLFPPNTPTQTTPPTLTHTLIPSHNHSPAPSVAGHTLSDLPHVGNKAEDMTAAVLLLLDTAGCVRACAQNIFFFGACVCVIVIMFCGVHKGVAACMRCMCCM